MGETSAAEVAELMEAEFSQELGRSGLRGDWCVSGEHDDLIAQIRCSDLAVLGLGPPDPGSSDPQGLDVAQIVQTCGRPVLGIPISMIQPRNLDTVLLAWDGSREATRALHDALPLISRARRAHVVSLGQDGLEQAQRAADHLGRHGLAVVVESTAMTAAGIGDEVLQRAAALNVDLVVAGAYSHSRVVENIFGGASRSLLRQMLVPVLMSH
jgi:nucleotide-binding universal stress UspA family protein